MELPGGQEAPHRVVLGTGNPGAEYEETRHNVGFMVADLVAASEGLSFQRLGRGEGFSGRVKAKVARGRRAAGAYWIVKPLTYMNLSGILAGALARRWNLPPESFFVVVDDLDLPLGRIRIRPAGSTGGHRGLASIEEALGSSAYPRLRLGIGRSAGDPVGHVLSGFRAEEREILEDSLSRAREAVMEWLSGQPLEAIMNRFNSGGSETR